MPATTPIYELPYMVGTDPPCFGPGTGCDNLESIFCDFVDIVEAQLDENDLIIGRTATAIPMASIEYHPETAIPNAPLNGFFSGVIPFDTVLYDTDNIVTTPDPDMGLAFSPPRNGVYLLQFEIEFQAPTGGDTLDVFFHFDGDEVGVTPFMSAQTFQDTLADGWMFASQYVQFTDTDPLPRILRAELGQGWLGTTEFVQARFSIFWHSDV